MSPEEERYEDAESRLHDLDHAVTEAQAAVDKAPADTAARQKRDRTIAVRDAGAAALREAEAALATGKGTRDTLD